jgi:hypothetical protein
MSLSADQGDELFLPASSHPNQASFFNYPSSPTYLYDDESGTFKTVWPAKSKRHNQWDPDRDSEWQDVRLPSPLQTPPRHQYYQPPNHYQQEEAGDKEMRYFNREACLIENAEPDVQYQHTSQQLPSIPGPGAAAVHLRTDLGIGQALTSPDRARITLYDRPVDDYDDFRGKTWVDADGVSEASFSEQSPRDDRMGLPSSREPDLPLPLDNSKAKLWNIPRRDVASEAPIPLRSESSGSIWSQPQEPDPLEDIESPQPLSRLLSDPGTSLETASRSMDGEESRNNRYRPRILSDPGGTSHWERRRDIDAGRSSLPSKRDFDDNPSSSFRVLNVQRVPVGSLELRMPRFSKEESKKLKIWKKLKGFVS